MECSVCQTRSSVGYCPDCHQLLCEECGVACADCGVVLCEKHRMSVQGAYLCKRCTKKSKAALQYSTPAPRRRPGAPLDVEEREAKPSAVDGARAAAEEQPKGFSFQDLMEDLEDDGFEYQPREIPLPETEAEESGDMAAGEVGGAQAKEPLVSDDPNEFVILTNSASRNYSLWAKTYWIAIAASVILFFLWRFPVLRQPFTPQLTMFIALYGLFWGFYGLYKNFDTPEERKHYFPPMILNFLLSIWAFALI